MTIETRHEALVTCSLNTVCDVPAPPVVMTGPLTLMTVFGVLLTAAPDPKKMV